MLIHIPSLQGPGIAVRALWVVSLISVAVLTGCRASEEATQAEITTDMTDAEIMSKVYDPDYSVPANFFADERAATDSAYSVYHVKDTSGSYEVCTNDFNQAYAWETRDNERRSVGGVYVGSYENRMYFEFIRELEYTDAIGNVVSPTSPGFARVFKCSYVSRESVDRDSRDGFAGYLNSVPLTGAETAKFVQYMWHFSFFWPKEKTVLDTSGQETSSHLEHSLLLALRTRGGSNQCDRIELVDWVFSVDRPSRRMYRQFTLIRSFEARLVDGAPRKCIG